MKRLFTLLGLLILLAAGIGVAHADDAIQVSASTFTDHFPQTLVFQMDAKSSAEIQKVSLVAQVGECISSRYNPDFTPGNLVHATYTWKVPQTYLPPGSSGQFYWSVQDKAGNQVDSPKQPFRVGDPTQKWQTLTNDKIALYWAQGDKTYGQALFDRTTKAYNFLTQYTGATENRQIQIYIYPDVRTFQGALDPSSVRGWEGGTSMPDYGVVLIGDEGIDWTKTASAHEMTHEIIHRTVQSTCGGMGSISLPTWTDEGLAMYFESDTPGVLDDPQASFALKRAMQSDSLFSLRSLVSSFPSDPNQAIQAYGQSWSVVDFLIRHYGKDKLQELLQTYKAGAYYDDALKKAFGVDTDGLENAWRQDVGLKQRVIPTRSNSTATPFPTFSLSTDSTPVPTSAPASGATETPKAVVLNATPVSASKPNTGPNSAPSAPANPLSNLCGGLVGVVMLGAFGLTLWQHKH
jgi:hypothetical protein